LKEQFCGLCGSALTVVSDSQRTLALENEPHAPMQE